YTSVNRKSPRKRTSRASRLNVRYCLPLNKIAQASHAQINFRLTVSSRWACSAASPRLHISQVSMFSFRFRANWRSVAKAEAFGSRFEEATIIQKTPFLGHRDVRRSLE